MEAEFKQALEQAGLHTSAPIVSNGKLNRFHVKGDKKASKNGWYVLFSDPVPAGSFGSWKDGSKHTWSLKNQKLLTDFERTQISQKIQQAHKAEEEYRLERQRAASNKAQHIYNTYPPATDEHAYLVNKAIKAPFHTRITVDGKQLAIPLMDINNEVHSIQFIDEHGEKRFLSGGRIKGCFFALSGDTDTLCICEGFATGVSIHERTGHAVACAMNAGNLLSVAKAFREKHPDQNIIICADNDDQKAENTGLNKASQAAKAINAKLAIPPITGDFNDYYRDNINMNDDPINNATAPKETLEMAVERLALLPTLEYDMHRNETAKTYGVRVSVLDQAVEKIREKSSGTGSKNSIFPIVEPWPDPVNSAGLLDDIRDVVKQFIVCNTETATATTLWIAFTWFIEQVQVAPIAMITAPEKRCGKSQLLNFIEKLCYRPLQSSNISAAAIFRVIEAHQPTLLIDEADSFLRENEEARGIINSGHTRSSAYVMRVVGDDHDVKQFSTWGAKAICGIGKQAETLMDRSIILELRRKLPQESVQRLRHANPEQFTNLRKKLARLSSDAAEAIKAAKPDLPEELNDRAQDNWDPLLAIADYAGEHWPELARATALKISNKEADAVSVSLELLKDTKEILTEKDMQSISSSDLIEYLCLDELMPWATYNRGKQLSPRQLATRLGEYKISPRNIRYNGRTVKGYKLEDFEDAFARYLPENSATPPQNHQEHCSATVSSVAEGVACSGYMSNVAVSEF